MTSKVVEVAELFPRPQLGINLLPIIRPILRWFGWMILFGVYHGQSEHYAPNHMYYYSSWAEAQLDAIRSYKFEGPILMLVRTKGLRVTA